MKTPPLMVCGHVQNATRAGHPSCAICGTEKLADPQPSLEGRKALCSTCDRTEPSSLDLAFFEYYGPGSPRSAYICKVCGMYDFVHKTGRAHTDHEFIPVGPAEKDRYYCGCRGWD